VRFGVTNQPAWMSKKSSFLKSSNFAPCLYSKPMARLGSGSTSMLAKNTVSLSSSKPRIPVTRPLVDRTPPESTTGSGSWVIVLVATA